MDDVFTWIINSSECLLLLQRNLTTGGHLDESGAITQGIIKYLDAWHVGLIIILIGLLAIVLAKVYNFTRKRAYNVKVSISLLITTKLVSDTIL